MKTKIKILVVFLTVFFAQAEWKRTDIFLLPDGNTINGL
jgi:hypothetical protein